MAILKIKRFPGEDLFLDIPQGKNIYEILADKRLMSAPCGGCGKCGKCGIKVLEGDLPITDNEKIIFSDEQLAQGWRLSCLHQMADDLTIALPAAADAAQIKLEGYLPSFSLQQGSGLGIAVDIGSTTVAALLVDMADGSILAQTACINSQGAYGQDVLSRISYAGTATDGLTILHNAVSEDIRKLTKVLLQDSGREYTDISRIVISGNTTMIHLLGGFDPSSLGKAPYLPVFSGALSFPAQELLPEVQKEITAYCLPAVSAFVGGDITAGILACRLDDVQDKVLFLDIGTNGEIVLAQKNKICACACATGPALEGMNISCGSIAKAGAIEDVRITDGKTEYDTIGHQQAVGVCGSGLLAAVAELRRNELLDKRGRLQNDPPIVEHNGKRALPLTADIYLTQNDIRQVQLAKGAILAGINCLLEQVGQDAQEIDRVIVAGQFGSHLKEADLLDCSILPAAVKGKISYVGNTALSGAYLCLMGRGEQLRAEKAVAQVEYLELAELEQYQKLFVQCMQF